jgi:signal transduction histidine kinase
MRRFIRFLGPHEIQPLLLGLIMGLFFLTYALGVFSGRYGNDPEFIRYGVFPAVVIGAVIGVIAFGCRAWQRRFGISWTNFLISLILLGMIAPLARAVFEFLPELPHGPQAIPVTTLRSVLGLWLISAVSASIIARLRAQVTETETALTLAREQQIQIIAADEEARRQVAIILHDRVQAGLITSCLELQALSAELGAENEARLNPMIRRLEQLRTFDVRGAARVLSPNLEDIDLQTALEELALQFEAVLTIDVDVDPAMDLDRAVIGSGLLLAAYRIVEQGLLNAVVHAGASRVDIRITRTSAGCTVTVADDGDGLSQNAGSGLGSTLVTTWTRAMHGEWRGETGLDGRGTALVAELQITQLTV